MGLEVYRQRRRFGVTPEPRGTSRRRRTRTLVFVVQKHRATRLHYDLRLEWNGVLLSWALPKGPSLDPAIKRMAVPTEDHPLGYADFEGVIPENEYGGGTVMLWDHGTWIPDHPDVDAALRRGELKFTLVGKKLAGSWVLVRTRPRARDPRPGWLLLKHRDTAATTDDITARAPRSVASGRLLAEIAWHEGGDVERAASGDPPGEIRALLRHPERVRRPTRGRTPAVARARPRR